jgi:hypothetical protein
VEKLEESVSKFKSFHILPERVLQHLYIADIQFQNYENNET